MGVRRPASLEEVLELLRPDPEAMARGRERMASVWRGEEPDYLPIILSAPVPEEREFGHYDMVEQFRHPERMLVEQIWGLVGLSRACSDAQLSVRANFGTGFLASVFGLRQEVFPDKMPWLKERLPKERIASLHPEDLGEISGAGLIPKAVHYYRFFASQSKGRFGLYLPDTQGPFDLAHLIRGDEIFTDLHDDPGFVRHLLSLCTKVYVEASLFLKRVIGEPPERGLHYTLWMEGGGVRVCEDTSTLISASHYERIVLPFLREALKPFGGGWVHFCGRGHHLIEVYLEVPEVKGINLGNPELYDFSKLLPRIAKAGKFYYGTIPREEGESARDYFLRVLSLLGGEKRGLILQCPYDPSWGDPRGVVEEWRRAQEEVFGCPS